jgi:YD repeat-containing protein
LLSPPASPKVRTKIRYDYSYIESAAVRIGDNVFEVDSFGQYALDDVDGAVLEDPSANLAGFPVYHYQPNDKENVFDIVVDEMKQANITLHAFKDLVSVKLREGEDTDFYWNSSGLLGSIEGKMLARDGVTTMTDVNAFGQEWQVRDTDPKLFRTARPPQYPEKCRLPSDNIAAIPKRRLGERKVTREDAEKACARLDGDRKTNCIFDGMCQV